MWDSGSLRRERYLGDYYIVIDGKGHLVHVYPLLLSFIPLIFFPNVEENIIPGP